MNRIRRFLSNDKWLLILLVIIHTLILFILNNYPKSLASYGDELLYYNLAKSINAGEGLKIRGADINFTNALYPIIISPIFYIKDTVLRYKVIGLADAFFMSLSSVPVYLIAKEIKLSRKKIWISVLIMCIWPELVLSTTSLCENIYFPLSLMGIYYCIRVINYQHTRDVILAAVFSWLTSFSKEVGLCMVVAFVIAMIMMPLLFFEKKDFLSGLVTAVKIVLIYSSVFLILRYSASTILFDTQNSYYTGSDVVSTYVSGNGSREWGYAIYAFLYYLSGALIAFLVLPVIIPMIRFDKYPIKTKKIIIFAWILFLVSVFVVVVEISLVLDYGARTPEIPIRYISQYMGLLFPISLANYEKDYKRTWLGVLSGFIGCILVFVIPAVFKQVFESGYPTTSTVQYVKRLNALLDNTYYRYGDWEFFLSIILIALVPTGIVLLIYKIISLKAATRTFIVYCCIICITNSLLAYKDLKWWYSVEPSQIDEMCMINAYVKSSGVKGNTCYIIDDDDLYGKKTKVYDTYFDSEGVEYAMRADEFLAHCGENGGDIKKMESIPLIEEQYRTEYTMSNIKFIINCGDIDVSDYVNGAEYVPIKGVEKYKLYVLKFE